MDLVLALLFTTLCGVHSASIPPSSLGNVLASKLDKLDKRETPNLDKIRRSVLADMKRLLDSQLATLFESAVKRRTESTHRKRLIPKTKTHPRLDTDTTPILRSDNQEPQMFEEPQNSELIKVLTDGSLQDPEDEVLRSAVDQLLQEEDMTADNIKNEGDNNEDQLNGENDTEESDENIYDVANLPPVNTNDKDRTVKSKDNKGLSHVIIEHVSKIKNKDDNNPEHILDLDEILKSAQGEFSGSLSQEDGNSKTDSEDRDSVIRNLHHVSNQQKEPRIHNYTQTIKTHDSDDNSFQTDGITNFDIDENILKTENPPNNRQDDSDNGELETRLNATNEHVKTNHHKHSHQHRKKQKGRQPMNNNDIGEKYTFNDDISGVAQDLNKDVNGIKENHEENEDKAKKGHNKRHNSHKTSQKRYVNDRNPHKHQSTGHHYRNHDKHKHNANEDHDHAKGNQHIIVRLINHSDESNESTLDIMHKKPTHENKIHSVSSDLRTARHHKSKETIDNSGSHDSSTSRENAFDKVNAIQDDSGDKNNPAEKKTNTNEEGHNATKQDNATIDESSAEEDELKRRNLTEASNEIDDDKQKTEEGNTKTAEIKKGTNEKYINYEVEYVNDNKNDDDDVTREIENVTRAETKDKEEKGDNEVDSRKNSDEINTSEDQKVVTKTGKNPKHDKTIECHHENDESYIIRDLIQNKETKKSYSLTLTLSAK